MIDGPEPCRMFSTMSGAHRMPVAPFILAVTIKNVFRHCQMSPGKQNSHHYHWGLHLSAPVENHSSKIRMEWKCKFKEEQETNDVKFPDETFKKCFMYLLKVVDGGYQIIMVSGFHQIYKIIIFQKLPLFSMTEWKPLKLLRWKISFVN